jgi:hypothetical protein
MTITADDARLGVLLETAPGTVPTNPAFESLRATGESVSFTPTIVNSAELTPGRGVADSALTGGNAAGDINFELSKNNAFELLLTGAFCSNWGDLLGFTTPQMPAGWGINDMALGKLMRTFSYIKEFSHAGLLDIQTFPESMVNTFAMTITPGQMITGTYGLIGGTMEHRITEYAGQSWVPGGVNPVMTAPKVVDIAFYQTNMTTPLALAIGTHCFNNFVLNINNNVRAIECIGTLGARERALGKAEVTLTAGIYFADGMLLDMLIDQDEFCIKATIQDSLASPANHKYLFTIPRAKLTAAPVVAGGTGQDVVVDAAITCLTPAAIPYSPIWVKKITA